MNPLCYSFYAVLSYLSITFYTSTKCYIKCAFKHVIRLDYILTLKTICSVFL